MLNVIVNGCNGRMGKEIIKSLQNHYEIKLVGQTGRNDDLKVEIETKKADVVLDFTHPSVVYPNGIKIFRE